MTQASLPPQNQQTKTQIDVPTGRLFIRLFREFERELVEELVARGCTDLTLANIGVLRHLNPEGLRISKLAEDAGMTKQAMGQFVRELVKKEYVLIEPDAADGRAKLVKYTPKGKQVIAYAIEVVGRMEQEYQEILGAEAYRSMRESLKTLLAHHKSTRQP